MVFLGSYLVLAFLLEPLHDSCSSDMYCIYSCTSLLPLSFLATNNFFLPILLSSTFLYADCLSFSTTLTIFSSPSCAFLIFSFKFFFSINTSSYCLISFCIHSGFINILFSLLFSTPSCQLSLLVNLFAFLMFFPGTCLSTKSNCYESPKKEKVSHAFEHLIQNPKAYNGVRI